MGHPCDRMPIMLQKGGGEPITIENFVLDNIFR